MDIPISVWRARPRVRRDCLSAQQTADGLGDGCNAQRPCPWAACGYHLFFNPGRTTRDDGQAWDESGEPWPPADRELAVGHRDLPLYQVLGPGSRLGTLTATRYTCALDLADRSHTLEEVGFHMCLTRERIRQIEIMCFLRLKELGVQLNLRRWLPLDEDEEE